MARARALAMAEAETPVPTLPSTLAHVSPEAISAQPERSPARQHLADSIAALAAVKAEIAELGVAAGPAQDAVWAARRALDVAEDTLRDARPRDTYPSPPMGGYSRWGSAAENEDRARRARMAAEAPPISIAEAKAAVEVAKDALDSARRTQQHYEDRQGRARQSLTLREMSVRDAVRDVLRSEPATLALAQESRRLTTRAAAAREAFRQIIHGDTIQPGSPFYGWDVVADRHSSPEAAADWSVSHEWGAAIAALLTDPDAPLPAV